MRNRTGNNPKRRIVKDALADMAARELLLAHVRYVGSGHHKIYPANYGLGRTNPRPTSSVCDALRPLPLAEATELLRQGVLRAMFSTYVQDGFPKYIWSVSADGTVYEAKTHPNTPGQYHGYPLEKEDRMCDEVKAAWEARC